MIPDMVAGVGSPLHLSNLREPITSSHRPHRPRRCPASFPCGHVYLKDVLYGDAESRASHETYVTARAEGASNETAYRQSLLVGAERGNSTRARREEAQAEQEELENEFGSPQDTKWYDFMKPEFHWD